MTGLFLLHGQAGGHVDLDAMYGDRVHRPAHHDRPWLGLCMIASLDGSVSVDGRSGGLGNANDLAVLVTLRRAADVILIGAGTAAVEQYHPPSKPGQRIGVVTASGKVDVTTDLFSSGSGFLVMPDDGPPAPAGVDVIRAGHSRVDLPMAVRRLGDVTPTPAFVQAEGGAKLNAALVDADCVDELDLTIAPVLAGGTGSRLVVGATEELRRYAPVHVVTDDDGYLFTRWVRRTH